MRFKNRAEAGKLLAQELMKYQNSADAIVVGLARGGVIVAKEVAKSLALPFDIMVVRKIGAPANPELGIGALTAGGTIYLNKPLIDSMGLSVDNITPTIEAEKKEANRRETLYCSNRKHLEFKDKIVILVDDGFATGSTMRVAIMKAKNLGAQKIIVAVPVMPIESMHALKNSVEELACLYPADVFWGVGQFYENFDQVTDDEVIEALG